MLPRIWSRAAARAFSRRVFMTCQCVGVAAAPIAALGLAASAGTAAADCVGITTIVCDGVDADGVAQAGDGTTVTVNPGATVNNPGGFGVLLNAGGDNTVILNNGAVSGVGGVSIDDDGQITNNGSITNNGGAADIAVSAGTGLQLNNSGAINGATGLGVVAGVDAVVTNSGSITSALGEAVTLGSNGSVFNSGLIETGDEQAVDMNAGVLVNSGTIRSTGAGANDTGLEINGGLTVATVTNSGLIQGAEGIEADNQVVITNSGSIVGTNFDAMDLSADDDTLIMLPGGQIQGLADFNGGVDTLIFDGPQNVAFFVEDLEIISAQNAAVFGASASGAVAAVDPTAVDGQERAFSDLIGGLQGATGRRFGALGANGAGAGAAAPTTGSGLTQASFTIAPDPSFQRAVWGEGFAGLRNRDGDAARIESDHTYFGGLVGYRFPAFGGSADIFAGGAHSRFDTTDFAAGGFGQEIDADSGFVGAQIAFDLGAVTVGGALIVGVSEFDSDRTLSFNGAQEVAEGDYTGVFVAPELRAVSEIEAAGLRLQPSLALGYTGLFTESYTETGSSANLSVDDQANHIFRARAQLAMPFRVTETEAGGLDLSPRIAVEGLGYVGDEADASLFGATSTLDDGSDDAVVRGIVGAQARLYASGGAEALLDVEGGYDSDEGESVDGRFIVRFNF